VITNNAKWLLVIINSNPFIQGNTRLQKYGLLVYGKEVLTKSEFFDDWRAGDFGGFSKQLMLTTDYLIREGYAASNPTVLSETITVNRYKLTDKGLSEIKEIEANQKDKVEKIKGLLGPYFKKSLDTVLDEIYTLFPQFTDKSRIKAKVSQTHTKNHSYLSPEFEIPIDNVAAEEILSDAVTAQPNDFVFNDEYFREKLAKSIGLAKAPKLDPKSFERLSGIISSKIKTKEFDSVDLVKSVRGC